MSLPYNIFKRAFRKLLLLFLVFILYSFSGGDNGGVLYRNYLAAVCNKTSFQYYLVVRIADINKNEVREFCMLGSLFRNALHKEWKIDYDELSESLVRSKAQMNEPRLFEFKNPDALEYLGMGLYSIAELKELEKQTDFVKLAK